MQPVWRIELFGQLRITGAGRTVERFRSRKTVELLGYLASQMRRVHLREQVLEAVWPGEADESSRHKFHVELSEVRRLLRGENGLPEAVLGDRVTVHLNAELVTTDAAEFAELLAAVGSSSDTLTSLAER